LTAEGGRVPADAGYLLYCDGIDSANLST